MTMMITADEARGQQHKRHIQNLISDISNEIKRNINAGLRSVVYRLNSQNLEVEDIVRKHGFDIRFVDSPRDGNYYDISW